MRVVDFESDFNKDNEGIKKTILGAATELKNESQSKSTGAVIASSEQKVPDYEPQQAEIEKTDIDTDEVQIEQTTVNDINLNTINTADISISTTKEEQHEENYDDLSYEDFDINNI